MGTEGFTPTRGFTGRPRRGRPGRLPPGQYDTGSDWPTLTAEVTPQLVPEKWTMTVDGLVETPTTWSWREIHALPGSTYFGDIHCVTTWSKLDTTFTGVSVDTLLAAARPLADGGVRDGALHHRVHDEPAARRRHRRTGLGGLGGTTAGHCPSSTAGRCACWCRTCTSGSGQVGDPARAHDHDRPGFWEQNGYHDRGDPWLEQRYQGDP